jgi:hypothetical protein
MKELTKTKPRTTKTWGLQLLEEIQETAKRDYSIANVKTKSKQLPRSGTDKNLVTGDHIFTSEDRIQRKSSLITSKLTGGPGSLLLFLTHWTFMYDRQGWSV